jgi:methionine synthase II (cobalamin-independent)
VQRLRQQAGAKGAAFDEAAAAVAVSAALAAEVTDLFDHGVAVVQLNAAAYADHLDDPAALTPLLELDRALLAGVRRPDGARLGLRVGKPGAPPRWSKGPALEAILALPADRFLLDIGPDAQDFDFLSAAPPGPLIVLGLVEATQAPTPEPDAVMAQIDRAAEAIDGERLALSPRGGFTRASGVTWDDQRRTLEFLADVATRWWGFAM